MMAAGDTVQTGRETYVYDLFTAGSIREKRRLEDNSENSQSSKVKQTKPQEPENSIKIQYKGSEFWVAIDLSTANIGTVIDLLLQKLLDERLIASKENKRVKFIYKGKVFQDPGIMLSSIPGFSYGETLQSMVSDISGGTRRNRRRTKGKTMKKQ